MEICGTLMKIIYVFVVFCGTGKFMSIWGGHHLRHVSHIEKKKGRVSKKARSISVCFKARGWRCQRPGPEFGQLQRPGLAGTRKGGKRMYLKHIVSTLFQPQNLVEE